MDGELFNNDSDFESEECYRTLRRRMVEDQIIKRGITEPSIISAMLNVPRHLFVHDIHKQKAYSDSPLPLSHNQTISQPYISALMLDLATLDSDQKVLELGTGSGYQTALLANIVTDLYSVELLEPLYNSAKTLLTKMNYNNIQMKLGDGKLGWKENAPYDVIIVSAAPKSIPEELKNQINVGGRIIIPIGANKQKLLRITKNNDGFNIEKCGMVSFVPLV
ncbi:MAG: protein-L-isoaspartate(D-aspartate) O-methyltransferase [Candidatus Marinimicrobia bacterium]|nr:protein-L-isoaspartate(D-aspartate) O-methyltransferase [Candidatus Neomarinimicrobiota bacterium]